MTSVGDFERCYATGRDRLAAQLYALTSSRPEAVEAVQEAWARAWERREVVGGYDDPEPWVRRVAYRVVVSRWRRVRKLVETNGPDRAIVDAPEHTTFDRSTQQRHGELATDGRGG